LQGAAATWSRFTSEFAPGGLIDEATQEERDLAWMAPTNDVNEGTLGAFQLMMCKQPQLSLLGYNLQAMYFHNDTAAFIKHCFVKPEDFKFLHKMAQESRGEDRKRKAEIVQHQEERNAARNAAITKRKEQKAAREKRVQETSIVLKKDEVINLKGQSLKDMVQVYKDAGAPNLEQIKSSTKVGEIRTALCVVISLYDSGQWKPFADSGDEDSDEEGDSSKPVDNVASEGDVIDDSADWEDDIN
ncbi:hypothetical protein FA15DRAFT_739248, partial [Coprinopsis marcescibilis]